jgi:hypothetical protein
MEGCKELTADISSVAGCLQALTIQLDIRVRVHISSFSGHKSTRKYRIWSHAFHVISLYWFI